ncbi:MAG: 3-phosphoshikimate 1-carboxyvinyltransferase [Kiritimatiellae bacterium]|nr:3-phosphoshikimate 1-carboxyvinyltransferase [Kiritimatiellia bacterium]
MKTLTLKPIISVNGTVHLPGSKSMSNRALLLATLASGTTEIKNLLDSDDVDRMLATLTALGVSFHLNKNKSLCRITGLDGIFTTKQAILDMGNAGTAMRPLCAALCFAEGTFDLTGDPAMQERPIADLVDALIHIGANIEYLQKRSYPPIRIHPAKPTGNTANINGNTSSQFVSALLMAAPLAPHGLSIKIIGDLVSKPYVDITTGMMKLFGVPVENDNYQILRVPAGSRYTAPDDVLVEGDASAATYFLAAAAIAGGTVRVYGIGQNSVQGDSHYADVLKQMGAVVNKGTDWIEVTRANLHGIDIDMNDMPDAAMTLAATALFADGKTTIRNIQNLRVKETNRLTALATELRKVGANVDEGSDYLTIEPPTEILPAEIDTYNDHRMAMSLSLAALGKAEIVIRDPNCTSKTFPNYFEELASLSSVSPPH